MTRQQWATALAAMKRAIADLELVEATSDEDTGELCAMLGRLRVLNEKLQEKGTQR